MTSYSKFDDDNDETNEEQNAKKTPPPKRDDKVLTILEALPVHMGWQQIFHLPKEMCEQVVAVIRNARLYVDKVKDIPLGSCHTQCAIYNTTMTFTDDDLLLDSKPHNCPLFAIGYIRGQKIRWILLDSGLAVNIMPKYTINDLGITTKELSTSQMMIQGLNLEGQHAIGMIHLELKIDDLIISTNFHVIDSKTYYKLMLGCSWLHKHGVVLSTLHQCLKYYQDEERKINGDVKPFTMAWSCFVDAKFFKEDAAPKKTMAAAISSTGKGIIKNARRLMQL